MLINIEKYIRLLKYLKEDKANGKTGIHLTKNNFPELYLHTAKVDSVEHKTIEIGLPYQTMTGDYIPKKIFKKYYQKSVYRYSGYVLNHTDGWQDVRLKLDIPIKYYDIDCILQRVKRITNDYRNACQGYVRSHERKIRYSKMMIEKYQKDIVLIKQNQTE